MPSPYTQTLSPEHSSWTRQILQFSLYLLHHMQVFAWIWCEEKCSSLIQHLIPLQESNKKKLTIQSMPKFPWRQSILLKEKWNYRRVTSLGHKPSLHRAELHEEMFMLKLLFHQTQHILYSDMQLNVFTYTAENFHSHFLIKLAKDYPNVIALQME